MRLGYFASVPKSELVDFLRDCSVSDDEISRAIKGGIVWDKHTEYAYRIYTHGRRKNYMVYRKKLR